MPSMWQWMCFNRRYRKRKPKKETELGESFCDLQDSLRLRKKYKVATSSPGLYCPTELHNHDDIIRFDLPDFEEDNGTHKKLISTQKRRPDNPFRKLGKRLEKKFLFKPFSTPNVNTNMDSMYGYVPKAVQDVYASSALEGKQIDDYYSDNNYMHAQLGTFEPVTRDDCIQSGSSSIHMRNFQFSKQFKSTPTLSERQSLLEGLSQLEVRDEQTVNSSAQTHLGQQFAHKLDKMMEMECFWDEEADVFY